MKRLRKLDEYVTFYELTQNGPEAGMEEETEVFQSFCEIYEPTAKDFQLGSLETSKTAITVIIRNAYPEYVPHVSHTFKIASGMYENYTFSIKHVAPVDGSYMKVVGES